MRILYLSSLFVSLLLFSCSISESENLIEEKDSLELVSQLSVSNPAAWGTMIANRGFTLGDYEDNSSGSYRSVVQEGSSYPAWDGTSSRNYIYTIFEDQFPNMGDYDFNDVVIKSYYTLTGFTEDENSIKDGWNGTINSYLVNDGASYDFDVVYMFYTVEKNSSGVEMFTRIPNDDIELYVGDLSSPISTPSGTDVFKVPFSTVYPGQEDKMFNRYSTLLPDGGWPGEEILFSISGLGDIAADIGSKKLWISTAVRVTNTDQYILPAGYPAYNIEYEDGFAIEHTDYLRNFEEYTNIPFCLEFVASNFSVPTEGQFVLDTNYDFLSIALLDIIPGDDPIYLDDPNILTDSRDPDNIKTYTIAQFGDQVWMTQNLNYTKGLTTDNYEVISETKGCLYTWYEAMNTTFSSLDPIDAQGICPIGWHIPSSAEWIELQDYLIDNGYSESTALYGSNKLARSMAKGDEWGSTTILGLNPNLTNSSGFSAIPTGIMRGKIYQLEYAEFQASWWTMTADVVSNTSANIRYLRNNNHDIESYSYNKTYMLSVRCVKD